MYGLGISSIETIFNEGKGVYCEEACGFYETGVLDTFYWSAENFYTTSSYSWAVDTGMNKESLIES